MGRSRNSKYVLKITRKNKSTSNSTFFFCNLMKVGYGESHKHSRGERSCVIGMAKAGININNVALYFDVHKTTA